MNKQNKEKLCNSIIIDYAKTNNKTVSDITREDIYCSSLLGVAMQYLRKTKDWTQEDLDYINNRKGSIKCYFGKMSNNYDLYCLTLRDILE